MIRTPFYEIEEEMLRRNLSLIRNVADRSDVEIILAFKAFALWKTFPIFKEYIQHTTASSAYEARLASEYFGTLAHTYSPAYTESDFSVIVESSSHISFNSLSQYRRFAPFVASRNQKPSLGLRVNPEYSEIETELYNPCAKGSRFGVLASDLPRVLPDDIDGLHIHCHCESSADSFVRTLEHINDKFSAWYPQLKWINFGGGHLMTRADYDVDLLISTLKSFRARWPHLKVILEPGSAFAWQTGTLVSSVVDIVENHGIFTAILDVSFTCHMPDCLEMPYFPKVMLYDADKLHSVSHSYDLTQSLDSSFADAHATKHFAYRLGGNSCLSGDYLGTWYFPRELKVGDVIVFDDMIHYTTVKTTMFNGVHHPSIVLRKADGSRTILREFTFEDYVSRMD